MCGVPDPRFSSVDPVIESTPGTPDTFHVVVRNVNNAPRSYRKVTLDFSASNVRLMAAQASGLTLDCAARTLSALTDFGGRVDFLVRFGGFDNAPNDLVIENGVILKKVPARSCDLDGLGGCASIGDLARFTPLLLSHSVSNPEADLNLSGGPIDLGDFAILTRAIREGGAGSYCP